MKTANMWCVLAIVILAAVSINMPDGGETRAGSAAHARDYLLVEPPADLQRSLEHSRNLKLIIAEPGGGTRECRFDPRKERWSVKEGALSVNSVSACPADGDLVRIEGKSKTNWTGLIVTGGLVGMLAGAVVGGVVTNVSDHHHGDRDSSEFGDWDWSGWQGVAIGAPIGLVLGPPLLYLATDRWEVLYKRGAPSQPPGYLGSEP